MNAGKPPLSEARHIYSCSWREEADEVCAYLLESPAICGYGATLKAAMDDLYLELLERGGDPEAAFEVTAASPSGNTLYRLGLNEASKLDGRSARLFLGDGCVRCKLPGPPELARANRP